MLIVNQKALAVSVDQESLWPINIYSNLMYMVGYNLLDIQ